MGKAKGLILIVDDEEDLCEILQYNLGNAGYQTEVAHSAEEALKRSLTNFDLILLDIMMDLRKSGYSVKSELISIPNGLNYSIMGYIWTGLVQTRTIQRILKLSTFLREEED